MRKANAHEFLILACSVQGRIDGIDSSNATKDPISPTDRAIGSRDYAVWENDCAELELDTAQETCAAVLKLFSNPRATYGELRRLEEELLGRVRDGLKRKLFFYVPPGDARLYEAPLLGWEDAISRFVQIRADVEEAAKCLALDRYAASIFHSMQIIEIGLIELGTLIGVQDPKSGWTAVTSRLKKILSTNYTEMSPFEQTNRAALEQIHGTVEALKNAWRNKIGHAHGRLVLLSSEFAPQIAEEVFVATRAFMRRLATELPSRRD